MRVVLVYICVLVAACKGSDIEGWLDTAKEGTKNEGEIWAVLVAGSAGFTNYRHQSDVCHLYQLLTKHHGIPRQHVIVMMYNDIAYNRDNATPGIIINALHGKDVYEGTMIDYMGPDVTPENFLRILQGRGMPVGSRKTLGSGPEDYVFVNFVDHGGAGVLGFPNGELHLADLTATFEVMQQKQKYKQMLWYVEACYSGSMFEGLSPDMNITAHTASDATESSWACVWDPLREVYLGDCWSLNWMNNTEQIYPNLSLETVGQQYQIVKEMTIKSHPKIYGDLNVIYNEKISTFMGHPENVEYDESPVILTGPIDATPAPDVLLETLRRRRARSETEDEDLETEIKYHEETEKRVQEVLEEIVREVSGSEEMLAAFQKHRQVIQHPQCNKEVMSTFYKECWKMQTHPYITKYTFWISNLCNTYNTEVLLAPIRAACVNV